MVTSWLPHIFFIILVICVLLTVLRTPITTRLITNRQPTIIAVAPPPLKQPENANTPPPITWGSTFGGPVSSNVPLACSWDGKPVCCSMTDDKALPNDVNFPAADEKKSPLSLRRQHSRCTVNRTYIPSSYETDQIAKAVQLSKISDFSTRSRTLLEMITTQEQLKYAKSWLERVRLRMHPQGHDMVLPSADDSLLSKFVLTKHCSDGTSTKTEEFIEPLTLHARHPFAFTSCGQNESQAYEKAGMMEKVAVQNLDYIMLASAVSIEKRREGSSTSLRRKQRNVMLDCGTSSFSSSLSWFTCGYMQQNVTFDHMYGWEYTLLEPTRFWNEVPPKMKHAYTFLNIPINGGQGHPDNPLNYIRRIALSDDFVSFKLDVDTPEVEIPIALELSRQQRLYSVVDEFFFELHFRCEIMMFCGWTDKVAEEVAGFRLDRVNVLNFFQDLRFKGVRAHVWP